MIIQKMSCEQFAGVRDQTFVFGDGMNIVVGPNETGKSTMIDLMYHLLFQDVKTRKSGEFQNLYFPKKVSGVKGDSVDGELRFDTSSGVYNLKKEWEIGGGSCKLTLPDGTIIKNSETINQILAKQLVYGRGMYDEMIFPSQKRTRTFLRAIFQGSLQKKTKDDYLAVKSEISSTVMKAVMETGGISVDELEKRLADLLQQYGERWDFGASLPEGGNKRGIGNKWACATADTSLKNNRAIILRAYYAMEEIAELQRRARDAEKAVDDANEKLKSAKQRWMIANDRRERFLRFKANLENREQIMRLYNGANSDLEDMKDASRKWPEAANRLKRAEKLKEKLKQAETRDLYTKVIDLRSEFEQKKKEIDSIGLIDPQDVQKAIWLEKKIVKIAAQLQGLNLKATIKQLCSIAPIVKSTSDNTEIPISNGEFQIAEAVDICIPGVMELSLMPAGVDIEVVKRELVDYKNEYTAILGKYGTSEAQELSNKQSRLETLNREVKQMKEQIDDKLDGRDWAEIVSQYRSLPDDVMEVMAIPGEIRSLCGRDTVDTFIGTQRGIITPFELKYQTGENLSQRIDNKIAEMSGYQEKLKVTEDIPAEYQAIDDVDSFDNILREEIKTCENEVSRLQTELSQQEKRLEDQSAEEYEELLIEKKAKLNHEIETYYHWKHISEIVRQAKEKTTGTPMRNIEEKFRKYLSVLTGNRVSLGTLNDNMDAAMASDGNLLAYEILSEGTKDTIALAFRLAVLEHLFPNGGGLAVFDDPFTDMDEKRRASACNLLKEFAKENQVIFVTCDRAYSDALGGNLIEMERVK